ncbi:MAG: zinc-binding protein [Deltaproteobacteria bacterium RBG_19FT_COMBO_46_9]|nr:MAG: zinc-binding protein [Deltaproteobacteria bacterium RBG_19FT_COMBO_46_9]
MSEVCCTQDQNIMILSCSGGSNVGQLANRAAVELTQEGFGKMFCLAGIGGGLTGFVQSAKDIPRMIVVDGCDIGCAKATLDRAGIPLKDYLVVTSLGIEKNKDFDLKYNEVQKVKGEIKEIFGGPIEKESREKDSNDCCG